MRVDEVNSSVTQFFDSSIQLIHVADKDAVAVEMDDVRFFQIVHDGGYGLTAGPDEVGDVLLGKAVLDQHFITDLTTASTRAFAQKLDDSGADIFQNQGFPLAFGFSEPVAEVKHHRLRKGLIARHDVLQIINPDGDVAHFLTHGSGKFGAVRFTCETEFAENGERVLEVFDDFAAFVSVNPRFYRAFHEEEQVAGRLVAEVDEGVLVDEPEIGQFSKPAVFLRGQRVQKGEVTKKTLYSLNVHN